MEFASVCDSLNYEDLVKSHFFRSFRVKSLEKMRRVCQPVKLQANGRENAVSALEICSTLQGYGLELSPDQVHRLMHFVVNQRQGFYAVDNKYYYEPAPRV